MSSQNPSHFFPDTNEGIFLVVGFHLVGVVIPLNLLYFVPNSASWIAGCYALAGIDLILSISAVALYRHIKFVIPHQREAAHHCPNCDYKIGEDRMAQGCSECGWQRNDRPKTP